MSFAVRTDRPVGGMSREEGGEQGGWIASARLRSASIDHRGYVLNNLLRLSVLRGKVGDAKEGVKVAMGSSLLPITGKFRSTARNASFRNRGGADW